MVTVLQGDQGEGTTRSDAPYPSPLFPRDSVMPVDAQANHNQSYNNPAGNHSNPGFGQPDFFYQNRTLSPSANHEAPDRLPASSRAYYFGNEAKVKKDAEPASKVESRSEDPKSPSPSSDSYRSPSPRSENQREGSAERPEVPKQDYGSPLSSDKENKTDEKPLEVTRRSPEVRDLSQPLVDRSRSPLEGASHKFPTKYPYDPHTQQGPLKFPFSYPLERPELLKEPAEDTTSQGRPLLPSAGTESQRDGRHLISQHSKEPRSEVTRPDTNRPDTQRPSSSDSRLSQEILREQKQQDQRKPDLVRDDRNQSPPRGDGEHYRGPYPPPHPAYYSQFSRSSTEGHYSDSDSGEAPSHISPGQPRPSHPSPGIPHLPGPLGALGQFPQFFPENANKDLFYCHLCSYVGNSKYHFNAHMNSHFEHQCPQCDYTSRTEGRLKRHIKDFHRSESPETEKAPENFSGQTKVMKREPGRPKMFKCRQCEFSSVVKTEFWEHARSHIKEDKILCCPKCPFVTEYKHHLEYHLRNHFGSKPFKCTKCNYSCVNKSMLNSHMKSHTNVYQYRCADCTYATKYCHSLKLHLRKYNHKPATVLNPDGSLPTDGSGDFELVSKRGPPRGPRGPKKGEGKQSMSPPQQFSPAAANMMLSSPQAFAAQAQGMMGGFPWMVGGSPNGLQPPPPLIPVTGMPPLSVQVPRTPGSSGEGSKASGTPASDPGSQTSDGDITPPPSSASGGSTGRIKSVMAENHDLFGAFGIPPESLMAHMSSEEAGRILEYRKQLAEAQMKELLARTPIKTDPDAVVPPGIGVPAWPGMVPETNGVVKQEPEMGPFSPDQNGKRDRYNDALAQDMAASIEAEARENGECPLDLTKTGSSAAPAQDSAMDLSPGLKRRHSQAEAPVSNSMEEEMRMRANSMVSSISTGSTSPTPRKRSRKGKAYKLDALCLKLQERQESPAPLPYDSTEEDLSDYQPGSNRSGASVPSRPGSNPAQTPAQEGPDLSAIHDSLRQLNQAPATPPNGTAPHSPQSAPRSEVARSLEAEFSRQGEQVSRSEGKTRKEEVAGDPLPNAPNGRYECAHCGISFRDCILYTMHMGYHGYKDPFKCNMCGHMAGNKVEFFLHIARVAHQ